MPRLLVRRPSPRLAEGELTHLDRVPIDPALAQRQWEDYVDVFRARGWDIIEVEPVDAQPDGVFVEDALVMFGDLAVLCRAGAASRRGESASVEAAVAASGVLSARIEEPGTLDGGDVLKVGRTVYVGASSRSNAAGIAQLRALLAPRGWTVVEVPVTKVLHLKSGVTALPDGTVVGFAPLVDDTAAFPAFLEIPEEHGTAVVVLDDSTVLMSADASETAELYRSRGLEVITTPVSEFEKLEGCVTCLSVRVRD
ncbi:dimethylargininase [Microbacterium sp. SSM24]|uniref:dimethylargininase n=1 Tax=Microbacterium sp. SSM24 TaxID=2991714 RepID=UPI0022279ED2|nr:dimethylargininase [Microbacterium sp. SSM24]MCW3491728.1 N(G),N(G)-dimethylarginine dimethylaminohydrolase [Microbacterium sp. SSM24]